MHSTASSDIGLVGLAVMGRNLVLNMADHRFSVSVYNRTIAKVDDFIAGEAKGKSIIKTHSLAELARSLRRPRRVMMLVKAGNPVDDAIEQLLPHLEPGDIIIDGGNSHYKDTIRRAAFVEKQGLLFIGTGVSGGEEGARRGASIMPGGTHEAWPHVKSIFEAIAATADDGTPCCHWMGADGAGHFVKMVHNGIEYGDMQVIAEAYLVLRSLHYFPDDELADVFAEWNQGKLNSYLIEITSDILRKKNSKGQHLLDFILDSAGQKGTGKWTAQAALEHGVPLTLIGEAVSARFLSALLDERRAASKVLPRPPTTYVQLSNRDNTVSDLHDAVYASKILSYTQGFMLLKAASDHHGWNLDLGRISLLWRGGCIIRSGFLDRIRDAYRDNDGLQNLLTAPYFRSEIESLVPGWRRIVGLATSRGLPIPAIASALTFFDGYRSSVITSASLIQAQRDYFGAHTYQRRDRPRGESFHTNWTGRGGDVTAGSYEA